jgi:hypothetical protein
VGSYDPREPFERFLIRHADLHSQMPSTVQQDGTLAFEQSSCPRPVGRMFHGEQFTGKTRRTEGQGLPGETLDRRFTSGQDGEVRVSGPAN